MRKIKFRGMDIDGRWFYGNLAVLTENVRHLKQGNYISNEVGMPFAYQVRPETVGQYTGLADKNGKEIYDGDIVNVAEDKTAIVTYENACFYTPTPQGKYRLGGWQEIEVIGNIHESPELLQQPTG